MPERPARSRRAIEGSGTTPDTAPDTAPGGNSTGPPGPLPGVIDSLLWFEPNVITGMAAAARSGPRNGKPPAAEGRAPETTADEPEAMGAAGNSEAPISATSTSIGTGWNSSASAGSADNGIATGAIGAFPSMMSLPHFMVQ